MSKKPLHKSAHGGNPPRIKTIPTNKPISLGDVQLWQDFQIGSESAFATIYEKNANFLYSYGLKIVSDKELVKDSIQDLFVELWDAKNRVSKVRSIKG